MTTLREAWLRGPVRDVPDLLQPVAHALLQSREEVGRVLVGFPDALLWSRPAGVAPVGFHLRHVAGVIDRLFTYARGEPLDPAQLDAFQREGQQTTASVTELTGRIDEAVDAALEQLRRTDAGTLTDRREVGRARLPSTVLGLLFHAAEHVQRHVGQLLVTARIVSAESAGVMAPDG